MGKNLGILGIEKKKERKWIIGKKNIDKFGKIRNLGKMEKKKNWGKIGKMRKIENQEKMNKIE